MTTKSGTNFSEKTTAHFAMPFIIVAAGLLQLQSSVPLAYYQNVMYYSAHTALPIECVV